MYFHEWALLEILAHFCGLWFKPALLLFSSSTKVANAASGKVWQLYPALRVIYQT
jgi:hypothetical protein